MDVSTVISALENKKIGYILQPKFRVVKPRLAELIGAELLANWVEDGVRIPPPDYMPIIFDAGFEKSWVCNCISEVVALVNGGAKGPISINVSTRLVEDEAFIQLASQYFGFGAALVEKVEFEVTEVYGIKCDERFKKGMGSLFELGYKVMFDDFGTGFSNLKWLLFKGGKELKLDKCFIEGISRSRDARIVIESLCGLAKRLGYEVIAEGVETEEQLNYLLSIGVSRIQGFLFAKPERAEVYLARKGLLSY